MENKDVVQPAAVAEETVQEVYRPNKKQTAIAWLFVAAQVLLWLTVSVYPLIPNGELRMLLTWIPRVLLIICWTWLIFMGVNVNVRQAAMIGGTGIFLVCLFPLLIEEDVVVDFFSSIYMLLSAAISVGAIQMNCKIQSANKVWLNMLPLCLIGNAALSASRLSIGLFDECIDWYAYSFYYSLWYFFMNIMQTVAYWKLARCEAFSGEFDATIPVKEKWDFFSEIYKWEVSAMVMLFVIIIAIIVIYSSSWFN